MAVSRRPVVPQGLSERSRKVWRSTVDGWDLRLDQLEVLRSALVALDRADDAGGLLARDGLVVIDRYGQTKPHPAASIETQNRALAARLFRELLLEPPTDTESRPRRN